MKRSWYAFIGGEDPTNVSNYYRLPSGSGYCLCGHTICVIYAAGLDRHPINPLSENMKMYITQAIVTGQLQPEKPYNSKKYVYLKDWK